MDDITDIILDIQEDLEGVKRTNSFKRSMCRVKDATYNAKKTIAQGMMDIALLTANANQLRYITEFRHEKSANFVILLILIVCSLILQLLVGVILIFKGHRKITRSGSTDDNCYNTPFRRTSKDQLDNYLVLGVFFITVINIFIATFTTIPR